MKLFQNTIRKNTLSKELLVVILLLSLFSFSGNNIYPNHQQVTKTELVVVPRSSKRVFSFKELQVTQQKKKQSSLSIPEVNTALQLYAQCVATKFENASRQFLNVQQSVAIFKIQNTPHQSDEDDLHFLRG